MRWKYKTLICKSFSRVNDFSSKFRRRRAADIEFPTCVKCHGQLRLRTKTKQTTRRTRTRLRSGSRI